MNSPKMYRRIILALLWMMFLMWIHGRNRKTQEEFEAQQEDEFAAIRNDPYLQYLEVDGEEVQDEETRKRIAHKRAMGKMRYAIERSQLG